MEDERAIRLIKRMPVWAPMPIATTLIERVWRGILKRFNLLKGRPVYITVEEMSVDTFFRYFQLLMDVAGSVAKRSEEEVKTGFDLVGTWFRQSWDTAKRAPELFVIATGIQDEDFFRALPPSSQEALADAIDAVNPTLREQKKTLEALTKATIEDVVRTTIQAMTPPPDGGK